MGEIGALILELVGPAIEQAATGMKDEFVSSVDDMTKTAGDHIKSKADKFGGDLKGVILGSIGKALAPLKQIINEIVGVIGELLEPIAMAINNGLRPLLIAVKILLLPLRQMAAIMLALTKPLTMFFDLIENIIDQPLKFLAMLLTAILKPIELLFSVLGKLISGPLKIFGVVLEWLLSPLEMLADVVGEVIDLFAKDVKEILSAIGTPIRLIGQYMMEFVKFFDRMVRVLTAPMKGLENTLAKGGKLLDTAFESVAKAVENPLQGIPELLNQIRGFVSVIDPFVISAFDAAMRDLSAVIGEALAPAFGVAAEVTREFAATMRPLLSKIAPVLADLARAIGGELMQLIPVFANSLADLIPLVKEYAADLVQGLRDQVAWLKTWLALKAAVNELLKPLGTFLRLLLPAAGKGLSFQQWIARAAIVTAAFVLKMVGAVRAFAALQKAFTGSTRAVERDEGANGLANAQNPTFKAIDQLGHDVTQSAFIASSLQDATTGTTDTLEDQFYKTVMDDLGDIKNLDIESMIETAVYNAMNRVIVQPAKEAAGGAARSGAFGAAGLLFPM